MCFIGGNKARGLVFRERSSESLCASDTSSGGARLSCWANSFIPMPYGSWTKSAVTGRRHRPWWIVVAKHPSFTLLLAAWIETPQLTGLLAPVRHRPVFLLRATHHFTLCLNHTWNREECYLFQQIHPCAYSMSWNTLWLMFVMCCGGFSYNMLRQEAPRDGNGF